MSQSSVSSSSHSRHERHLMRQRGAGPRNVTATFGFAFDFPTHPQTSSSSALIERPTKRRKTIVSSTDDVVTRFGEGPVSSIVEKAITAISGAVTEPLPMRSETAAVSTTYNVLKDSDVSAAISATLEVLAARKSTTQSSKVRRKAQVPSSTRDFSTSPAARGVGDDSFVALLRPKRKRVIKTTAKAATVLETIVMPAAAEVQRLGTLQVTNKPLNKPPAIRKKAKSRPVKSAIIAVTLSADGADAGHSNGHEATIQLATLPTEVSLPPQIALGQAAVPPRTDTEPRKKAPAEKNEKFSKAAPARRNARARAAKHEDAAESLHAADQESSTKIATTDVPTETGSGRVRTVEVANDSHLHTRTRMPFSYAEDPDDSNVDIAPKEKPRKRALAKKSGKAAITAAVSRRKKAVPELSNESRKGDGEREMDPSPESPERLLKQRRPLHETHANAARHPSASPGKMDFDFTLKTQRSRKNVVVVVLGEAGIASGSDRPLVLRSSPPPDSKAVGHGPAEDSKPRKAALKITNQEDVDWLLAPKGPLRQLPQHGASSTRSKATHKRRKLADVLGVDLDDLVMNIGSFVTR
ncbi:hypothetical protein LTR35_007325 [Friedmanniomyces endolithicus]|uniref:Uncharacterized protein n=2 Tax=Friedmanniomyces endolithicus TaxID=329885 RepID=A0AAN6JAK9_9PEZI|nr:hypothetical protein LTR35_007325 [Friedmanniomyces endolithicus]KAK0297362.1 hypothetical protein LTS00_004084 [Friedmanniomyces endolithicus]KAK0323009.1 hypothetical protein LTR82_005938 [Friedmanniomyces endolithicus]KAK0827008.1 hypothetical protein LTR73_005790 [Friedmanniomyces endolithicus]KAK1008283.1 hypothetical protein LTR54_006075 [Friedmanniomyces endolithicus]